MEELDDFFGIYFNFKDDSLKLKKNQEYELIDNQGNELKAKLIKENKKDNTYLFHFEVLNDDLLLKFDLDENDKKVLVLYENRKNY